MNDAPEELQASAPQTAAKKLTAFERFALATSYISILPLSRFIKFEGHQTDDVILHGLAKYLPAVGLLIGAILAIATMLVQNLGTAGDTSILRGVIIVVLWLTLTGGLHFDGLMDTADGIFSHRDHKRMLEIMQDPRAGNFAIITGMSVFALKTAALSALFMATYMRPGVLPAVMFLIPAWGRFAEAYAIGRYGYAKPEGGKGKVWHDSMKFPFDLIVAGVLPLLATACVCVFFCESAFLALLFTVLGGMVCAAYLNMRLGGHTGDTYGAVVEVSETIGLIGLTLLGPTLR